MGAGAAAPAATPATTDEAVADAPAPDPQPLPCREGRKKVLASPAVRQRAKDLGVDLASVKAEGDRLRHSDLDAFLRYGSGQGYHAPHASRARDDETIKVIGMRRKIAENMAASKRNIPHFTYVDEIDVTSLEDMRADLNNNRGGRPKLTMLPLMIVAICRSLPDFPMLNARYDDEAGVVTRSGRVHLGMAAQTDAGLTVPVIRDAQDKNVWQLAAEISRLAEAARAGKLKPDEMGGGTITVTSLGPLGGIATTPGDQPARSRDHRSQQDRRAPGVRRRRNSPRQADEPVDQLRPPRRRRLGRRKLRPGAQEISRDAGAAVRRLIRWRTSC